MVRWFSWCTLVALVVLLFVTTEGLRERNDEVEDDQTFGTRNRGVLRFNSKSQEETSTETTLPASRSKFTRGRTWNTERQSEITTLKPSSNAWNPSRRTSGVKETGEAKRYEPVTGRNGKRYTSGNGDRIKSRVDETSVSSETPERTFRRSGNRKLEKSGVTNILSSNGPTVFTATTEHSKSRTGRKIQTSHSTVDLKTLIPSSRRYSNKNSEEVEPTTVPSRRTEGRDESTVERRNRSGRLKANHRENDSFTRRGQDAVLSETANVRVDIPLKVDGTENLAVETTEAFDEFSEKKEINRRSDNGEMSKSGTTIDRSKFRGRLNESESVTLTSRSNSRRGSSRYNDPTAKEANEQTVSPRRNAVSRDRSRNSEKKNSGTESRFRSRSRNSEDTVTTSTSSTVEQDVKRKSIRERNFPGRKSRVLESNSKSVQEQDGRGRSRGRSRLETTTAIPSNVATTIVPDLIVSNDVATSTESETVITTVKPITVSTTTASSRTTTTNRPSTTPKLSSEGSGRGRGRGRGGNQTRKQSKEDFFNHGLGFRGRKYPSENSSNVGSRKPSMAKNDTQYHGNLGWTLRRRPGHSSFSQNPSTVVPSPTDQTNEVIPSSEQVTSTEVISTVESVTSIIRKGYKAQQATEESSTVAGTTTTSTRRGNKTYDRSKTFGLGKSSTEPDDSDNYPPDFKARLSQLKNTNVKIPALKSSGRSPLEVQLTNTFGQRSRSNSNAFEPDDLETSASENVFLTNETFLVNPIKLINDRGKRVKKSSASLFAERSRMKLVLARRLVKPKLNIEETDLDATTASSYSKSKETDAPTVDETSKVAKIAKLVAAKRKSSIESSHSDENSSKLSRLRKGLEDSSKVTSRPLKKGRVVVERMVTSISVKEETSVDHTTKPYVSSSSISKVVGEEEAIINLSKKRTLGLQGAKTLKQEEPITNIVQTSEQFSKKSSNIDTITTVKPKKSYLHQLRNKLREQSTTEQSITTVPGILYTSQQENTSLVKSQEGSFTKNSGLSNGLIKSTFRPRYSKATRQKFKEGNSEYQTTAATPTTTIPVATSRYSKKKSAVIAFNSKASVAASEETGTPRRKLEVRARTSTYRRHSEVPTTLVESSTKVDGAGVAITPKTPRYHATLKPSSTIPRSVPQVTQVNLKIANDTVQETPGITGRSNGDSGNTNIFSPSTSVFLTGNRTLMEQLRSTVAPLLSSLGNKTPVFSGAYSNVNSANTGSRITPNGSPPRFSARYKGAELLVRKQNAIYQPTVPSITSSLSTPSTPVENSGSAPLIDVSNPGEPKFLTFYHALESASIRNEQLQRNSEAQTQMNSLPQADSTAPAVRDINNNSNNDTTSPDVATVSPQTPDTIANTTQDNSENSTPTVTGAPENPTTVEQASTSSEPPSTSSEPPSTSTEPPFTTEQAFISTESLPTTEQSSTNASSTSTPAQTSTTPGNTETGILRNVLIYTRVSDRPVGEVTVAPTNQSSTSTLAPSTPAATDSPVTTVNVNEIMVNGRSLITSTQTSEVSTTPQILTTTEIPLTVTVPQSSTETMTDQAVTTPTTSTSENPESNTIELSDTTINQSTDRSTEAPTTESIFNNIIDMETTTENPTVRNRLIDYAQDILSHLQLMATTTVSSQDVTTNETPVTEISNAIAGSSMNDNLESRGLFEEPKVAMQEDSGTTVLSTVTTDQSDLITTEMTTQSAVTADRSNEMVTTQEANTQDGLNTIITTQSSQTVSSIDVTTVGDSDTLSPSNMEVTTTTTSTSTNDTLLTELMSIAKTLLSEEMNQVEQFLPPSNLNITSRFENLMENEVDRPNLSDEMLGTTQIIESSSILPTTETADSPSTTASLPESTTLTVDPSQNEVDSTDSTTTDLPSESSLDKTTASPENILTDNEMEVVQSTQATSLGPSSGNVESSTSSATPNEPQVILSSRISTISENSPDTTTQAQTTTQSSETTVTPIANFELTTNTYDLVSPNLVATTETQSSGQVAESTETATTNTPTVTTQSMMSTTTNSPEITTVSTVTEGIPSSVNIITTTPPSSTQLDTEQTTVVSTTEFDQSVTNVDNMINQTAESQFTTTTTEVIVNENLEVTTTTTAPQDVDSMDISTNQSFLTSTTETSLDITTNTPSGTTPQIAQNLKNKTPIVITRFQDTTSANAQETADSRIGQDTENNTPMPSSTLPPSDSTSTLMPSLMTTISSLVKTTTPIMTTLMTETTTLTPQTTTQSTRPNVAASTAIPETTSVTTVETAAKLVSTTAESVTTMSTMAAAENATTQSMTVTSTQMTSETTTQSTPPSSPEPEISTTPQIFGRFGGNRPTPAPRFSQSSTTSAPLRDYLVYGIYPNKTIVRKRPEDNLIDARNVDSPYVIFGIFPDGRLVRKFPNGTIIPDPPRNPVEVVFTLRTTTTTNRPQFRPYYNQANQDTYNQAPVFSNNRRPVDELMRNVQSPSTVDSGLTGNAIVDPNGVGPDNTGPFGTPASAPSTGKMRDVLLNTRMGTTSSAISAIAGRLTPMVSTGRPPTDSQGGRIIQDRERDEATRRKEAGGQRSSVYIGQDKFVNYWTNGVSNPIVSDVKINTVSTAQSEGLIPFIPSFENLLNSQSGGQVTAPPGFPWKDPLDQIFGITTPPPMITASVASNRLDEPSEQTRQPQPRPINPYVEVFTPFSSSIGIGQRAQFTTTPASSTTANTDAPTATTTTMAPTTTTMEPTITPTTTTTMAPTTTTTTTTTMAPTTTTTTTTMAPPTTSTAAPPTTTTLPTTTAAPQTTTPGPKTIPFNVPFNLAPNMRSENAFGRTFDDLVFLNSLLQGNDKTTTSKTLTEIEQMLANKILSLALNKAGPPRSPKAISSGNVSPNSVFGSTGKQSSFEPIVIDLSPSSTAATPTWKQSEKSSQTPVKINLNSEQVTWKPVPTSTTKKDELNTVTTATAKTIVTTTKKPVVTTPRPRTTTARSFGSSLWEALFGNGFFGPSTTQKPKSVKSKQTKTTQKSVSITPKPIPTTETPQTTTTTTTLRSVDISKIHVSTPNSFLNEEKSASTSKPISTTKQPLLNNPNSRLSKDATSTFSPEQDAQFLISLLRAFEQDNKASASKTTSKLTKNDELFLKAILSGQGLTTTPAPPSEINNAALLAALLKAQGIEPPTPINIREQLQSASLSRSVTSVPTIPSASDSTTITTRPTSTATRPTDTTKKTVTPRPSSRPTIRTTTWSPSSTYPPPLFSSFANYGTSAQSDNNSQNGALFGATRAFSQFLGAAITGAAQRLQSLMRNGTRFVTDVVG